MKLENICQYLDWDSQFFGKRIGCVTANKLTPDVVEQIMQWCRLENIDCLYFLAEASDDETVRLAEESRFHFVDVRVTLESHLQLVSLEEKKSSEFAIRQFKPEDIPVLRAIARVSHRDSRFYHDPNFPRPLCDVLYETWIEKSCYGYADTVLVAEFNGKPGGYITCKKLDSITGQIGLLGVASDAQGKGMGHALVYASQRWFLENGFKHALIVTQGGNCHAQHFYQRCGFFTSVVQLWYHRWFLNK